MWKPWMLAVALLAPLSGAHTPTYDSPGPRKVEYDVSLDECSEWWGYNQSQFGPDREPLSLANRAWIAGALEDLIDRCGPGEEALIAEALLGVAAHGATLLPNEQARLQEMLAWRAANPDARIRERAVLALGVLANPASVPLLSNLALDEPKGRAHLGSTEAIVPDATRAFAVYALGLIGASTDSETTRREIVEVLWRVCETPRAETCDLHVAAVLSMGLVPLEITLHPSWSLAGDSPSSTKQAPKSRCDQIRYLLNLFVGSDYKAHKPCAFAHMPRSIVRLMVDVPEMKPAVVQALLPFVTKRGHVGMREQRRGASLALGELGDLDDDPEDQAIRHALRDAAGNADRMVKAYSIIALGRVGGRAGTGSGALSAEQEVRDYLTLQLTKGKTVIKPWAGLALGVMDHGLDREVPPKFAELRTASAVPFDWEAEWSTASDLAQTTDVRAKALRNLSQFAGRGPSRLDGLFSHGLEYRSNTATLTGGECPGVLAVAWRPKPPDLPHRYAAKGFSCIGGGP